MILYKATAKEFIESADNNILMDQIEAAYQDSLGRSIPVREISAYQNSLPRMATVLRRAKVADDCGVLIEYKLPLRMKRLDFVVTGKDEQGTRNFLIIELKQWLEAEKVENGYGLVETFVGGARRTVLHPSEQSSQYSYLLSDFNENVASGLVNILCCSYLHNYKERKSEPLLDKTYEDILKLSRVYFQGDQVDLELFIYKNVGLGDGMTIIDDVENSTIRPQKKLIEHYSSILEGNKEYVLLDNQRLAYKKALSFVGNKEKSVYIVIGGPGTGKSVVAINLFYRLLKNEQKALFIAPNSSFRDSIVKKLADNNQPTRLRNLFKGSSGFVDTIEDEFDALVVDESHRLKNGSAFMYNGDNQVKDLINAAKTSIFFIDDNQMVRPSDIGSVTEIKKVAKELAIKVDEIELKAQFRCSGVDGYISWLNDTLHIQETANYDGWEDSEFDFKIFDDPNLMRSEINKRSDEGKSARILAGYAWKWTSIKEGNLDGEIEDVEIPEFNFQMPWNSRKVGTTWAIDESGINQVGCIHTAQGLEFDYVGVIVGNDLGFDADTLTYSTDHEKYKDSEGKKGLKEEPERLNELVRNIYKVLMTRGMKGCYIYFCDEDTKTYFKKRINR